MGGGQIKTAFAGALRRPGIAEATPHDCRHTWATWLYMLTKDPMLVMREGDWSSLRMVERYPHLAPSDVALDVHRIWGVYHPAVPRNRRKDVGCA